MKLTNAQACAHADEVRETSVTVLKGALPTEVIDIWSRAFAPLLAASIGCERDGPDRGPHRYHLALPFHGLWADPAIIDNDAIMAVVEQLVGADGVIWQLASDTPLLGSEHQELRCDGESQVTAGGSTDALHQLAVNFPLLDVSDETGAMEYAPGTHRLSRDEGMRRVKSGEIPLVKACLARGDVMIRDARHIHRGTPNRSATPRPMIAIGYSRRGTQRPEMCVRIPAQVLATLPDRARRWLRHNPVFECRAEADRALLAY